MFYQQHSFPYFTCIDIDETIFQKKEICLYTVQVMRTSRPRRCRHHQQPIQPVSFCSIKTRFAHKFLLSFSVNWFGFISSLINESPSVCLLVCPSCFYFFLMRSDCGLFVLVCKLQFLSLIYFFLGFLSDTKVFFSLSLLRGVMVLWWMRVTWTWRFTLPFILDGEMGFQNYIAMKQH